MRFRLDIRLAVGVTPCSIKPGSVVVIQGSIIAYLSFSGLRSSQSHEIPYTSLQTPMSIRLIWEPTKWEARGPHIPWDLFCVLRQDRQRWPTQDRGKKNSETFQLSLVWMAWMVEQEGIGMQYEHYGGIDSRRGVSDLPGGPNGKKRLACNPNSSICDPIRDLVNPSYSVATQPAIFVI